jgi:hypothetical protein
MANIHDLLGMWKGSQSICAPHKQSRAPNKPMTAVGCIIDTSEIVKASWSLFQHDGAAVFQLSERSPLPPALTAKDLPGGRTQMPNVCRIRRFNCHSVESDEDSAPESISDSEDGLYWNGDLDDPTDSKDDCAADIESDIMQDNGIKHLEGPEQRNLSAAPYVAGLLPPTRKSKTQSVNLLVMVNGIKMRRNEGVK